MAKQRQWNLAIQVIEADNGQTIYRVLATRDDAEPLSFDYIDDDELIEGLRGKALSDKLTELVREQLKGVKHTRKVIDTRSVRV